MLEVFRQPPRCMKWPVQAAKSSALWESLFEPLQHPILFSIRCKSSLFDTHRNNWTRFLINHSSIYENFYIENTTMNYNLKMSLVAISLLAEVVCSYFWGRWKLLYSAILFVSYPFSCQNEHNVICSGYFLDKTMKAKWLCFANIWSSKFLPVILFCSLVQTLIIVKLQESTIMMFKWKRKV